MIAGTSCAKESGIRASHLYTSDRGLGGFGLGFGQHKGPITSLVTLTKLAN